MAIGKEGNVKWVDGLRGLASAIVVCTHLARAFAGHLFGPTTAENVPPILLQYPIIRIPAQGRIGVTIFSFVTGFVCALKPLKLCNQGRQEDAFMSMSRSSVRRVPRLVLPPAIATFIVMILNQLGVFNVARSCDSWWAANTSPPYYQGGTFEAIKAVFYNIVTTWTRSKNEFDGNQWTLKPLLLGAFGVYAFVLSTAFMQQRFRMLSALGIWLWWICCNESTFGNQFFWGIFLCDLQQYQPALDFINNRPRLCRLLSIIFMSVGLFVASYPEGHPEWQPWSQFIHVWLERILPEKPDFPRFSSGIGLHLITLGLHFSPWLRELLASRYLIFLGKQSFAVYLLHGPLLRWVLVWMLYGVRLPPDHMNDKGEVEHGVLKYPGNNWLLAWLLLWVPLNYGVAMLWTGWVDPWCDRMTDRIVSYVKLEQKDEKGPMPK